ncbi:MAG: S-methyl-5-thioribose-1-phosphate isomerase [Spirochaetia bacterium]|nr:S-methyl-5-thioribose-1-phosphate isomerase [Spirochaetia bacterium]
MNTILKIQTGVEWTGDRLYYIDQTRIPLEVIREEVGSLEAAEEAIVSLKVRGAPAIATFASFALVLSLQKDSSAGLPLGDFRRSALKNLARLISTRPTAVNLSHAMQRMRQVIEDPAVSSCDILLELLQRKAEEIQQEDKDLCASLGRLGNELIGANARIMTHCNTGALATAGIGTAIGAFYTAHGANKNISVFACETRPLLQGSRLTSWELDRAGIRTVLITDNMAAHIMRDEKIDLVMVGADRIARNGDTANKIGTLGLAILAKYYDIPFYVVAPSTSVDPSIGSGSEIEIEERNPEEVRRFRAEQASPPGIPVRNPAFDVTPGQLISAIVTENGIHRPPYSF